MESEMQTRSESGGETPLKSEAGRQFVSGFLTGFGICAAVGVAFLMPRVIAKLGQRQEKAYHRVRSEYTNEGEGYGEIPGVISDSGEAIKEAVDSLGKTFREGREILDSVSGAINKLRE